MAASIPIEKLASAFLSDENLKKLENFANSQIPTRAVVAKPGSACYNSFDWRLGGNIITLGLDFYKTFLNITKPIPYTEVTTEYTKLAEVYLGVFYHELGHSLFTNLGYLSDKLYKYPYEASQFIHEVHNILEDVSIEGAMKVRYPDSAPFIDTLSLGFSSDKVKKLVEESIKDNPTSPDTLTSYLLAYCRQLTFVSDFPSYDLWNKYRPFLEKSIDVCIQTIDSTLRAKRQMAFALQLMKILEGKEPDMKEIEQPNLDFDNAPDEATQFPGGSGQSSLGKLISKKLDALGDTQSYEAKQKNHTPQDLEEIPALSETVKAGRNSGVPDTSSKDDTTGVTLDLAKSGIRMIANDDPAGNIPHIFNKLSKFKNTSAYTFAVQDILTEHSNIIKKAVGVVRKLVAHNNTGYSRFKMTGKFDVSSASKPFNFKLFMRKNAPSIIANLIFAIMVDLSGSMHGSKARLAGRALLIFCQVLDILHIPFCVRGFTQIGDKAITISLKDYDEPFSKVKSNMALLTECLDADKLGVWGCNIDERNLKFVSDELDKQPQKDKVLIVISDGATCGSAEVLAAQAKKIEGRGTSVLGVGIFDNNVEKIYKNHIVLKTVEDLQSLPGFLNKYLVKKIFKGGDK